MYFCYIDESGGFEPPDRGRGATPVMVVLGLIIDAHHIPELTREFIDLKRGHFPRLFAEDRAMDDVLTEIKGSDLLKMTRHSSRDRRRQAARVRTEVLDLLERFGCQIIGRVWVKVPGEAMRPDASYGSSMQDLALHFNHFLLAKGSRGVLIADSRAPLQNSKVAHSIFTQKWRAIGDPYPSIMEVSLFAHSQNHVGIQLADLVASTLVFPMAAAAYGAPAGSVHASPRYQELRNAHGDALDRLQYRYQDGAGRPRGGLVVSDRNRDPATRLVVPGPRAADRLSPVPM